MQGIYNCIPEINNVSRVFSVAVVLYLQFLLRVMLFPMLNILVLTEVYALCGCFLQFTDFMFSPYVAQV
jgi:hypothetical protein